MNFINKLFKPIKIKYYNYYIDNCDKSKTSIDEKYLDRVKFIARELVLKKYTEYINHFDNVICKSLTNMYSGGTNIANKEKILFTVEANLLTLKKLPENLISIKLMRGPVDQIFKLEYTYNDQQPDQQPDDNSMQMMSLDVKAHTIEATSINIGVIYIDKLAENYESVLEETSNKIVDSLVDNTLAWYTSYIQEPGKITEYIAESPEAIQLHINVASNHIGRMTRMGTGNRCLLSSKMFSTLADAFPTRLKNDPDKAFNSTSVRYLGTILNIDHYEYDRLEEDEVVVFYKGSTNMDGPAILCPYHPYQSHGVMLDPVDFRPVIKFGSRFGILAPLSETDNYKNYIKKISIKLEDKEHV